jgi:hypothetical protein
MDERTIFRAGHVSASTVLDLYFRHPSSAVTPLSGVDPFLPASISQLVHLDAATQRDLCDISAALQIPDFRKLLTSVFRCSSSASNLIWAVHILVDAHSEGLLGTN